VAKRLGYVGLGNMGVGMACRIQEHVLKGDSQLLVWNRTASKADPVVKLGAVATSLEEIGAKCDIIFACLGSEEAVIESSDAVLKAKPESSSILFVDTSTISPACVVSLAEKFKNQNSTYLNNPVWGPPEWAANGTLVWVLSGPAEAKAQVTPFLQVLAKKVIDAGEKVDAGAKLKICGNCTLLSIVEVLSEAMQLVDLLEVENYMEFLETFFAGSAAAYYAKRMHAGGYEIDPSKGETPQVAVSVSVKDLKFARQLAKDNHGTVPTAEIAIAHMEETAAKFGGHHDLTAIYGLLRSKAGLPFGKKSKD